MERWRGIIRRHMASFRVLLAVIMVLSFVILVPLILGRLFAIPQPAVFALITSTLIFQALAVAVGIGLGIDPLVAIALSTSVAIGVMIAILQVCDLFSATSSRVAGWLDRVAKRTEKYSFLHHYGVVMLIPIIWIPGIALYGSPIIAWIFQWEEIPAISCMVTGWLIASSVVAAGTVGVISIFL
jgi:uncharacterized membrane protein